jgi:hypothetical protein
VTPAEEVQMKTKQYREVVEKRHKSEKEKLDTIKSLLLMEGRSARKSEKIDITSMINK